MVGCGKNDSYTEMSLLSTSRYIYWTTVHHPCATEAGECQQAPRLLAKSLSSTVSTWLVRFAWRGQHRKGRQGRGRWLVMAQII